MNKKPFKNLLSKAPTFRNNKGPPQRSSRILSTNNFTSENDVSMFNQNSSDPSVETSHLNETTTSGEMNCQPVFRNISEFNTMSDEQINEEFEKSILVRLQFKKQLSLKFNNKTFIDSIKLEKRE